MTESAQVHREPSPRVGELSADVGRRIRAARLARGMSLAQVGRDDLTRSFLSLVENGRSRISLRALSIVADRLELPISHFLEGETASLDVIELVLDRAEAALNQMDPKQVLRLLQGLEVPPPMRPRALWLRGWALSATNQSHHGIAELREALDLARPSGDAFILMEIRYTLGLALYGAGVYDEALLYLREAMRDAATEPEDTEILGKSTVMIGHILYARGETDAALQHYERAKQIFGSLHDLDSLASMYSGMSLAYERKGDYKLALQCSKRSLGVYSARHYTAQAAGELNNIAIRYMELGDLERARSYAEQAIERAVSAGATRTEAMAHTTLADIHLRQGERDAAANHAGIADRLAQNDDDPARMAAWRVLGALAESEGRQVEADELYARALGGLQEAGYKERYNHVALEYSKILRERGDFERALQYALDAAQSKSAGPM